MATSTAILLLFFASQVLSFSPRDWVVDDRGLRMNVMTFTAYINGSQKAVSGQTMYMQGSEIIVELNITENWYYGTGNVDVVSGGIGKYATTWSYDVPQGAELAVTVQVVSNKYWWNDPKRVNLAPKIKRNVCNSQMNEVKSGEVQFSRLTLAGSYGADSQLDRAVRFIHSVDDKFVSCYGEASWFGGKGKTTLTGGIGRSSLDVNHNIPINVSALYVYECHVNRDFPTKTEPNVYQSVSAEYEIFTLQKFQKKEEIFDQIYGTFAEEGEDVWNFRSKKITNMTGEGWFTNGKGNFHKQAGGKGHTFLVLRTNNMTDGAYGSFKYDLTIKP